MQLEVEHKNFKRTINATLNDEPTSKTLKYKQALIGKRFGKLVVIAYPATAKGIRKTGAICKCDCGAIIEVNSSYKLLHGDISHCFHCGHEARSEAAKRRWIEHPLEYKRSAYGSLRNERLFKVWRGMKSRSKETYGCYSDVGMCDEWQDYRVFREWAYSHGYDEKAPRGKCTIDRINPFGNYEPENCRFISISEQAKNKRSKWKQMDEETRRALVETIRASAY